MGLLLDPLAEVVNLVSGSGGHPDLPLRRLAQAHVCFLDNLIGRNTMLNIYAEGGLIQRRRPFERSKVPPLPLPSSYRLESKRNLLRHASSP